MAKRKGAKRLPFHIQHNTTPTVVGLMVMNSDEDEIAPEKVSSVIGVKTSSLQKRIAPFLRQLGVLDGWRLSEFGERLKVLGQSHPDLLAEALHVHLYTLHWRQPDAYFSFAYATICDWLWERGTWVLDGRGKAELVGVVVNAAAEKYGVDASQIAFSQNSVSGAINWLKALNPSVITRDKKSGRFFLRDACPVQTLLWSIDALYHHPKWRRDYGVRIILDDERLTQLCKICLIDLDGLEKMLDFAVRTCSRLTIGTEGGFGRWLSLTEPIPVGMLWK
ncbi:MAG: hypothetical protein SQA66_15875 [Candidatus Fervidibacter sacchari]